MSFTLHETDDVFHAIDSYLLGISQLGFGNLRDLVYDAYCEYDRLLEHAKHQRMQLRYYQTPYAERMGMQVSDDEHRWLAGLEDGMERTMTEQDGAGSSITDELREWFENGYRYDGNYEKKRTPWFGWKPTLEEMLDRIDERHRDALSGQWDAIAEQVAVADGVPIEELGYVRLPLDADGVPIRVGDAIEYVVGGNDRDTVSALMLTEHGWEVDGDNPECMRHVQPDSWERIKADARKAMNEYSMPNIVMELVARCERLASR